MPFSSCIFSLNAPPGVDDARYLCFTCFDTSTSTVITALLDVQAESIRQVVPTPQLQVQWQQTEFNCKDRDREAARTKTKWSERSNISPGKPFATQVARTARVTTKLGYDFDPHLSNTFETGCVVLPCVVLASLSQSE